MKITVLGTGTSQGVPMIACDCYVCQSPNAKDKRLRSAIMITANGENYVIDAGPDFRQQMLRAQVKSLRGVIFTHEHKDHIAGLDDVRAFNYIENRDMDVYCSEHVDAALKREYHYVFSALKYRSRFVFDSSPAATNVPCFIPYTSIFAPTSGFKTRSGSFTRSRPTTGENFW